MHAIAARLLVLGLLLYAMLAGPIARMMPVIWLWPESMATRALGEKSAWDAGQRLMQTAAPESWGLIVAAAPLADGNREAVQAVLDHARAQGAGRYAFLGDYVGYGADPGWVVDTVMAPDGTHQFLFNVPDDSCCAGSSYDYEYDDQWHCAEWYVDAATQSYQFFYDGAEVTEIAFTGVPGAHIEGFESIIVGWIDYQSPSTPNEGWYDDLAIDDERIGCD